MIPEKIQVFFSTQLATGFFILYAIRILWNSFAIPFSSFKYHMAKIKKTKNESKSIDMALFFVVDFLLIFCISFICGINENSAWLALVVFFAGVIVNFLSYVFAWITSCGIVKVCYFIYGVKMD